MRTDRAGHTLVEALVAMVLTGLVATALAGAFVTAAHSAARLAQRLALDDATRTTASVLPAELRAVWPASDLGAMTADSIAFRIFRGVLITCDSAAGSVSGWYRGLRALDPRKDSLLWLRPAGRDTVQSASGVNVTASCPDRAGWQRLSVSGPAAPPASLLLAFERGGYHLQGSALRYSRGRAGRQPVTGSLLATPPSAFTVIGAGEAGLPLAIEVLLMARDDIPVAGAGDNGSLRFRATLLNGLPR